MKKIINILFYYYSKLPNTSNWFFWFMLALVIKSMFFALRIEDMHPVNANYHGTFAFESADTSTYIDPIESLLKEGTYYDDYRMPGLGWLFFLLRMVLPLGHALDSLVIIQLLLSSLSVYLLAKIAFLIFQQAIFFYATFVLYAISIFVSYYDNILLTESLCTSSLICSVYFLIKLHRSNTDYILSGLFITWSIFLRPVYAPLILAFLLFVLVTVRSKLKKNSGSFNWKYSLLFITPFLILDGLWTLRNYEKYKRIYPLTKSFHYSSTEDSYLVSLFNFVKAYGGSIVWWNPGSDITFFLQDDFARYKKIEVMPPAYIYTSKFNYDSLFTIKQMIAELKSSDVTVEKKTLLNKSIKIKLETYTNSIRREKPILYYFTSRLRLLKTFLIHSGTSNLFNKSRNELTKIELLLKVFYSLLYLFVILFGLIGCALLLLKGFSNVLFLFLSSVGWYCALAIPFLLKFDEYRYFVPGYPFFLISGIYAFINIFTLVKKKIIDSYA